MNDISNPASAERIAQGIYSGISSEQYHRLGNISKSGLWTIYTKTPAHYRFAEPKESQAFDFGSAVHTAILEPNSFERAVMRGPADRRGNLWKDSVAEATNQGRMILTSGDYDAVLEVRDAVHANAFINSLITGGTPQIEQTAIWDERVTIDGSEYVIPCRARPDLVRPDLGIMLDVKTTQSASAAEFARSVANYGYHVQEYWYGRGWGAAGGGVIKGTVFLAIEKEAPYAMQVFELDPTSVAEGGAIAEKALRTYAECMASGHWPAYPEQVTQIMIPKWAYRELNGAA